VLAISTDTAADQKTFKDELKAPFPFIPDPDLKLTELYDVKMPMVKYASRTTFVIDTNGKVVHVDSGSDALDPGGAITSCPLHKPAAAK
jgi:thioredoxin-dependent peroxiredoxin